MKIYEEVKEASTIGISGHVRPDGDCIGSVMGLYLYLCKKCPQAQIEVFLEQPAEEFSCISGIEKIHSDFATKVGQFDAFIVLDAGRDRIGDAQKLFDKALKKINIDHHVSNTGDGDVNFIDPHASSASELVYRVIDDKEAMDVEIAKALYMGIVHDTGVFQYSNTSPETLRVAADLVSYGFDFSTLIDETFYEKTYVQNQILGRALLESFQFMNGKCIVSMVDKKTMAFYNANQHDLEGIVSQLRYTKGVECAIFMYQTNTLEYKVSLRSNGKVDVAKIAMMFGGGGHVRAAGVSMQGTYYDIINNLSAQIEKQLHGEEHVSRNH